MAEELEALKFQVQQLTRKIQEHEEQGRPIQEEADPDSDPWHFLAEPLLVPEGEGGKKLMDSTTKPLLDRHALALLESQPKFFESGTPAASRASGIIQDSALQGMALKLEALRNYLVASWETSDQDEALEAATICMGLCSKVSKDIHEARRKMLVRNAKILEPEAHQEPRLLTKEEEERWEKQKNQSFQSNRGRGKGYSFRGGSFRGKGGGRGGFGGGKGKGKGKGNSWGAPKFASARKGSNSKPESS